jgi:hypothetical protein
VVRINKWPDKLAHRYFFGYFVRYLILCSLLLPWTWDNSANASFRQQIRYFGTLGAATFDGKYAYDDTDSGLNVSDNTRFGLNISVTDDREWSFFAELLAQPSALEAPWYFVNWRAADSVIIRIGKTRFVNWLFSETRSIGYTYPWPELPADVYRINPLTSMHGVSAEYSLDTSIGGITFDLQVGTIDGEYLGTIVKSDLATSGTLTYQIDDFKWIFSGLYSDRLQLELGPIALTQVEAHYLSSSIRSQLGPVVLISEIGKIRAASTAAERDRSRSQAARARAQIQSNPQKVADPELQAALGKSILTDGAVISATTGYLHIGYEIGSFQPYLLGVLLVADKDSIFTKSQSRYGGGVFWLASDQVALKLQATHVAIDNKNYGLSSVPQESILLGTKDLGVRPATLVQASVDFLF